MFGDLIKTTMRTGAAFVICATILVPFFAIRIPNMDYSFFTQSIGKAYAIMTHWVPNFSVIWPFATGLFAFWVALMTARLAIAASRIVLTIFK